MSDATTLVLYGLGTVAVIGIGYLIYRKVSAAPQLAAGQQSSTPGNQQQKSAADAAAAAATAAAVKAAAAKAAADAAAAAKAAADAAAALAKQPHCINQLGEPVECPPSTASTSSFATTSFTQQSLNPGLLDQMGNY